VPEATPADEVDPAGIVPSPPNAASAANRRSQPPLEPPARRKDPTVARDLTL